MPAQVRFVYMPKQLAAHPVALSVLCSCVRGWRVYRADRSVTPRQTVGVLYEQLQCATKLLLEYKQNPAFRTALKTLDQAEETARALYTNEKVRLPLVLCT